MRQLSDLLPLTFAVRAIEQPWLGSAPRLPDLMLLTGMLLAAGTLSVRALHARP